MDKLKKILKKNEEIIRYVIVGGLTTLFNLLIFTVMCKVLHIDVTISNVTSVVSSILFAYVFNKLFVFQSHCVSVSALVSEMATFIGARLLTMVIEVGGVYILVNLIKQDEVIGKLETQVIVLIANYLISKFLVFKDKSVEMGEKR